MQLTEELLGRIEDVLFNAANDIDHLDRVAKETGAKRNDLQAEIDSIMVELIALRKAETAR